MHVSKTGPDQFKQHIIQLIIVFEQNVSVVRYHLNLKTSAGSWNVGKGSVTANLTYVFDDGDIQNDDHPLLNTPSEIGPNMQISRNRFAMSLGGARLGTIDYIKSVTVKYTPAPGNVNNPCYIEQLTIIQLMPTVGKKYFCNTNLSGIMKPNEEVVFDQNC